MAADGAEPLDPAWLTAVLRECGALTSGSVVRVGNAPKERHTATVATLDVAYTVDASPFAPTRIFLKHGTRKGEPGFYTSIAPSLPAGIVPNCYYSLWDAEKSAATLLFEDLSAGFDPPSPQEPPTDGQVVATLRALATLHGTWWQRPNLAEVAATGSASSKQFVLDTAFERFD